MVLLRQTMLGSNVYKLQDGFKARVWEWNGINSFTEGSKGRFGEGISAIAEDEAKARLMIAQYAANLKGWRSNAVR